MTLPCKQLFIEHVEAPKGPTILGFQNILHCHCVVCNPLAGTAWTTLGMQESIFKIVYPTTLDLGRKPFLHIFQSTQDFPWEHVRSPVAGYIDIHSIINQSQSLVSKTPTLLEIKHNLSASRLDRSLRLLGAWPSLPPARRTVFEYTHEMAWLTLFSVLIEFRSWKVTNVCRHALASAHAKPIKFILLCYVNLIG